VLAAGAWAGLAWHTDGHLPLVLSGTVAAILLAVTPGRPRGPRSELIRGFG
jgi:hypothetical protein